MRTMSPGRPAKQPVALWQGHLVGPRCLSQAGALGTFAIPDKTGVCYNKYGQWSMPIDWANCTTTLHMSFSFSWGSLVRRWTACPKIESARVRCAKYAPAAIWHDGKADEIQPDPRISGRPW